MTGTVPGEPNWSLERRESSGHLVWKQESPNSKVRFRFDVEVLEFEKHPDEHTVDYEIGPSFQLSSSIVVCATCIAAVAMTLFLPWYLVGSN